MKESTTFSDDKPAGSPVGTPQNDRKQFWTRGQLYFLMSEIPSC
jgi:hypothetical protein